MKEEIDPDIELDRMDNNSGDQNSYGELIVNNADKIENIYPKWNNGQSLVNYMQYSKYPKNIHAMSIKPINKNKINVG